MSKIINNVQMPKLEKVADKTDCALKLSGLASDVFEKTASNVTEVIELPKVFKGSSVSMHHDLNGMNSDIRDYLSNPNPISQRLQRANEYTKKLIETIDKEFVNLPPTTEKHIVYRGRTENPIIKRFNSDFPIIYNAKVGDEVIPDLGYSYTGFHESLARNWAFCSNWKKPDGTKVRTMIQEIILPIGSKVSRNLEHGGEVVMPRGAKYKILSKETDKDGILHVKMQYILP